MKKFIFVAIFLMFITSVHGVFAQEMQGTDSADVLGIQTVDYALPYPGLLPDNFLYPLKAFRDKLVSLVIGDPVTKAEFDVLQADKRLEASLLLFQKQPMPEQLVVDTLSKGENYFSEGVDQVTLAKKQGQGTTDILGKMEMSNKKHVEIITIMEQTAPASLKQKLAQQLLRVTNLGKLVSSLQQNRQ